MIRLYEKHIEYLSGEIWYIIQDDLDKPNWSLDQDCIITVGSIGRYEKSTSLKNPGAIEEYAMLRKDQWIVCLQEKWLVIKNDIDKYLRKVSQMLK